MVDSTSRYMAFSTVRQDAGSDLAAGKDLADRKYGAQGSLRTGVSVALTGQGTGAVTITSMWDSSDACFAARAAIYGDAEIQAWVSANNQVGVSFGLSKVRQEVGDCEGAFACAAVATATDHSDESSDAVTAQIEQVIMPHGINGFRQVQLVAAGETTGAYINLFYTNSVDAYLAGSAAAWSDPGFVAVSQKIGATIVDRLISKML
jgi:hypothetical protein